MKQTAVEWLEEQLKCKLIVYIDEAIQKAKAMEKEQIMDAWDDGCYQSSRFPRTSDAERYYNETFKSE